MRSHVMQNQLRRDENDAIPRDYKVDETCFPLLFGTKIAWIPPFVHEHPEPAPLVERALFSELLQLFVNGLLSGPIENGFSDSSHPIARRNGVHSDSK